MVVDDESDDAGVEVDENGISLEVVIVLVVPVELEPLVDVSGVTVVVAGVDVTICEFEVDVDNDADVVATLDVTSLVPVELPVVAVDGF